MNDSSGRPRRAEPQPDTFPRCLARLAIAPQHIPLPALPVWPSLDEQVAIRAALIHNMVIDPATRAPWVDPSTGHRQTVAVLAPAAFASGLAMGQKEASEQSIALDEEYLDHANTAKKYANAASTEIENAEKILDDLVEFPANSQRTGRDAVARHGDDQRLAEDREAQGDFRHQQSRIDRIWIVLAALLLAALDVMLLWRPVLNLGDLNSAGELYKWVLALVFAGAQAYFIDLAVHRYHLGHREAFAVRDAMKDHRRRVERAFTRQDMNAVAEPPPRLENVYTVDDELRSAFRWLLATAFMVGLVGVFRVAFLAREAGQSTIASTLFGAIVGFILGGLVLLLGLLSCRGNQLGDSLHEGAAIVASIGERIQIGRIEVSSERDTARVELTSAETARVRAHDVREWVVGEYRQALLLATGWLRLDQPSVELVVPRELKIAEAAAQQVQSVNAQLEVVDRWLRNDRSSELALSPSAVLSGRTLALPQGRSAPSTSQFNVPLPLPPNSEGVALLSPQLPPPPREPWWLLLAGAAAAVAVAVCAAMIAPTPQDDALVPLATATLGSSTPTAAA